MVDDDPKHSELLKRWLESEGHEAILAQTLEEGFLGIATPPLPDVVLLDIHMEKRRGLMLVHWARKQRHLEHMQIAAFTELKSFKELKSIDEGVAMPASSNRLISRHCMNILPVWRFIPLPSACSAIWSVESSEIRKIIFFWLKTP